MYRKVYKTKKSSLFIKLFSKNPHYLENNELLIIGEGELENDYRRIIKKGNLKSKVNILGYKKNIFNYIYKAKCVISSSLWEDPGFIMVESAFVGTPIISSDCPNGPKEFIGNGDNGFIFKSNNENSFKEELDIFLNFSKNEIFKKKIKEKKRYKFFKRKNNYKKLSYLLN